MTSINTLNNHLKRFINLSNLISEFDPKSVEYTINYQKLKFIENKIKQNDLISRQLKFYYRKQCYKFYFDKNELVFEVIHE